MNWRDLGDVPLSAFEAEFRKFNSPMLSSARATWEAAKPHSGLCLGQLFVEQKYHTLSSIPYDFLNPLSQTRPGATSLDGVNRWMRFPTYEAAVRYWKERITSTTGPYKDTVTLIDLINVYAPAYDNNNPGAYAAQVVLMIEKYQPDFGAPPVAEKPKILLTRGHGTTGDTGAFANNISEEAHNKRIVPAVAKVLRDEGWDVTTFPEDPTQDVSGTLDTEGSFARDWMARLGGQPGVMIDCHLESSSASGIFAIVPNLSHLVTGASARQDPADQWANNVGDRTLGKLICQEINNLTGMPIRTGWVREPGLMSEDMTWVGQGGGGAYAPSRLAMFGYTSPYVATVYRLVVEFGALQSDSAIFGRADFPLKCGQGILNALRKTFAIVDLPVPPPEVIKITEEVRHAYPGAIIRERPNVSTKVKVSYKKRTAVRVIAKAKNGQVVGGSGDWFQIKSKGPSNKGFVHSSGLARVETV
jgi:hypothetical protein